MDNLSFANKIYAKRFLQPSRTERIFLSLLLNLGNLSFMCHVCPICIDKGFLR